MSRSRGTWELWPPTEGDLSVSGRPPRAKPSRPSLQSPFFQPQTPWCPKAQPTPAPAAPGSPRPHLSCSCRTLQGTRCRQGPWESWLVGVGSWQGRDEHRCWGRRCLGRLRWLLCLQHTLGRTQYEKAARSHAALRCIRGSGGTCAWTFFPTPELWGFPWIGFCRVPETWALSFIESTPPLCFLTQVLGQGSTHWQLTAPIWLANMSV